MKKKIMKKSLQKMGIGLIITTIVFASFLLQATTTAASRLTNVKDTLTRLKQNTAASHTIVFTTPVDIDNNDKIEYDFSNITDGDLSNVVIGDLTFNDGADRSIAIEAAGTDNNNDEVVIDDTADTITIHIDTSGTGVKIDANDTVTFTIANDHLTNVNATGLKTMKITVTDSDGTTVNADADLGIYFLSDDQVVVSATVDPILSFAIEGGYEGSEPAAVDFGTLIPNFYHKLLGERPAYAGILFTANPAAGETVTVNSQAYTFKATQAEADDQSHYVLIGNDFDDTAENLYRAINNTDSDVRAGLDPADPSQIWIVASAAGTGGNGYTIVDGTSGDVTLTEDSGSFIDGQAGSNYRDSNLGFGETDGTDMGNEAEGTNLVISTNAVSGYVITVQDQATGFYNGADEIPDWSGQYGFGLWAKARSAKYGECDPSANEIIADAYDVDTSANPGTLSSTAATLASYSGPTSKDHISIEYVVRIDADQAAGNYSDTLTYIATSTY